MNNSGFSERQLQEAIHEILSDPSVVRRTVSGKRLQILSPGSLNVHGGPDFSETAVLTEGTIFVGDSEFHRRSSEWFTHNHHKDPAYDKVVLHIVFDDNSRVSQGCEILKLDAETVEQKVIELESRDKEEVDIFSVEELQHYALLRLLRKTSEVQKILNFCTLEETVKQVTEDFLNRYNAKRTRPVYTDDDLEDILKAMPKSAAYGFLNRLSAGASLNIPDIMIDLLKQKILNEGAHLRREIALNCVLPTALCLANEETRINLFLWYWSTPALNTYGVLTRRFKGFPQNYLWQQQGMLQYIKEHGKKTNVVKEAMLEYGFAEVLSFYRLGRSPYRPGAGVHTLADDTDRPNFDE